jgi:hypothetical protein
MFQLDEAGSVIANTYFRNDYISENEIMLMINLKEKLISATTMIDHIVTPIIEHNKE